MKKLTRIIIGTALAGMLIFTGCKKTREDKYKEYWERIRTDQIERKIGKIKTSQEVLALAMTYVERNPDYNLGKVLEEMDTNKDKIVVSQEAKNFYDIYSEFKL